MNLLVEKHPYSHVLRLAQLSLLKQLNEVGLEDELNASAVHLPNRKVLFNLVEKSETVLENIQSEIEDELVEIKPPVHTVATDEKKQLESKSDPLEKQYLTAAVQSTITLEVDGIADEIRQTEEVKEKKEASIQPPKSFLDFISGEGNAEEQKEKIQDSNEVIESFLKNEKREKVEFFDPERMAKKSLEDKEGLVSDTLARIYVNQGNYAKAIDAYERLILKYPEKSGYFAARIEKVNDLQRLKRK